MKAALVGCGQISEVYFNNIQKRFTNLEITACCAAHFESAQLVKKGILAGKHVGIMIFCPACPAF